MVNAAAEARRLAIQSNFILDVFYLRKLKEYRAGQRNFSLFLATFSMMFYFYSASILINYSCVAAA